jgi:uncharacterized protein
MMPRRAPIVLVFLLALAVPLIALIAAELQVPFLSGRVNDLANMIPGDARQRIEQKLAAFEQKTGAQVAVLTIPSLEGEPIEDFSLRVVEAWKLGKKGKDNGVLFLISKQDRRMRIEVGYGLEGDLTDLETSRIMDNVVAPYFRNGDFGGGIEKGVDSILASLEGQEVVAPEGGGAEEVRSPGGNAFSGLVFALVIGVFSLMALTTGGAMGWILYFFMMPFIGGFGLPVLIGWVVLFPILKMLFGRKMGRRGPGSRGGWWGGGPFIGGGFGGGGGGWGGGGGGFSGGGGSFGGGGSSGSW